jgi:hypothetical protein
VTRILSGLGAIVALQGCGGLTDSSQGDAAGGPHDAGPVDVGQRDAGTRDSATCQSGRSLCDGVCVDEQTDDANCGGCGIVCTGQCTGGRCIATLATGACAGPLAVDAMSVYWASGNPTDAGECGSVMKVPLGGGDITTLYSGPGTVTALAIDATSVYWTYGLSAVDGTGRVMKVPLSGGTATTLASGQPAPAGIVVNSTNVFWGNLATNLTSPPATVMSAPLSGVADGGSAITLAMGQPAYSLAIDSTSIYLTGADGSAVVKLPLAGGSPETLWVQGSGTIGPEMLAINAANIYWTGRTDYPAPVSPTDRPGSVMKVPLGGGSATTLAKEDWPFGVAVDDTSVYWTGGFGSYDKCKHNGTVKKVPVTGGTPVTLAPRLCSPAYVAVDATSAYWTDSMTGTLMKVTPK